MSLRPQLIITPGEPAGIGPDILLQVIQQPQSAELIAIADPTLLQARAAALQLPLTIKLLHASDARPQLPVSSPGELWVLPQALPQPPRPGHPETANAASLLAALKLAAKHCQQGWADALVTGPLHKAIINDAGIAFSGHTEYLAEVTGGYPVMMLASPQLRVALATTHLPLQAVSAAITAPLLKQVIEVLHQDLQQRFGIAQPRILVCGLNPHAGEGGHLGQEEIDIIQPLLDHYRQQGWQLQGPLPADTLFTPRYLNQADAVLAMYHDQGLPVLKYAGFGQAVNITLGLPIIRTSVDHGTALDLAASGKAEASSLQAAIDSACQLVKSSHPTNSALLF